MSELNPIPEYIPPKRIKPFFLFMKGSFPFIEDTFEALDYYTLICKLGEKINELVDANNDEDDNVKNLYDAFVNLYQYVVDYFENLDVQDEIDNKLDEMAESGQLEELIAQFLGTNALFCFDTLADLKASTLESGSYARTLGHTAKNDGGAGIYKITSVAPNTYYETLTSGLYAELIIQNVLNLKTINNDLQTALENFENVEITSNEKIENVENILLNDTGKYILNNLDLEGTDDEALIYSSTDFVEDTQTRELIVKNSNFDTYKYLQLGWSKNVNVDNCKFSHAKGEETGEGYGLLLGHTLNANVTNSIFDSCERHALYCGMCGTLSIINNLFKNHRTGLLSTQSEAVISIQRGTERVTITNNKFINNTTLDINVSTDDQSTRQKIKSVLIADNEFINTTGRNIKIGQTGTATDDINVGTCVIENNVFAKSDNAISIDVYSCERLIIRNNSFYFGSTGNVIAINNTNDKLREIVIEGNSFDGNYTNAIQLNESVLTGTTRVIIRNNTYNTNGTYVNYSTVSGVTNPNLIIDTMLGDTLALGTTAGAINIKGAKIYNCLGVANINGFNSLRDDFFFRYNSDDITITPSTNLILKGTTLVKGKMYHFARYNDRWYES